MCAKKQHFIVIDTETAALHPSKEVNPHDMRVYDCGWIVATSDGLPVEKRSFVSRETFRNFELMQTAYYAEKLPHYYSGLLSGEWVERTYLDIWKQFLDDCRKYDVKKVFAYNCYFDCSVLNATIKDYSNGFRCKFLPYNVKFYDIMGYVRNGLATQKRFKKWCEITGNLNAQGKPSLSAETVYRYLTKNASFNEAHTALRDCEIELEILRICRKRGYKSPCALGEAKNRNKKK